MGHKLEGRILIGLLAGLVLLSGTECRNVINPSAPATVETQSPAGASNGPADTVRVLPYWVPSAQFAGYYVGMEKGIFRKHGIELKLLEFDPLMSTEDAIRDQKTDFAILWLVNALDLRSKGVDIVDIAQISWRSSLMLITRKSSGISRLEDMNGKKAGIWIGYELQPRTLFRKYHLNVEMIPIGSTNNLFLQGGVDILNANWFDEYHSIINNGINEDELNRFFFADYGLNFLEDGIYCREGYRKEHLDLCSRFVAATLESWQYAFDHQEEAIDCVVRYATARNQPVNRPHQEWMLNHYRMLYIPEGGHSINTLMKESDFEAVEQILLENGSIRNPVPFHTFYQPCSALPGKTTSAAEEK